jgi:hypothetical protein
MRITTTFSCLNDWYSPETRFSPLTDRFTADSNSRFFRPETNATLCLNIASINPLSHHGSVKKKLKDNYFISHADRNRRILKFNFDFTTMISLQKRKWNKQRIFLRTGSNSPKLFTPRKCKNKLIKYASKNSKHNLDCFVWILIPENLKIQVFNALQGKYFYFVPGAKSFLGLPHI